MLSTNKNKVLTLFFSLKTMEDRQAGLPLPRGLPSASAHEARLQGCLLRAFLGPNWK